MNLLTDEQVRLEETRRIAPPSADREPLKANVYERMAKAAAQLMPLFPYEDAGSIVPCGSILFGGPDQSYGHFFHWNTACEVVVVYGSNNALVSSGQIRANQNLHGVNSFLRDEKDPEAYALIVVTQHQSVDGDQREAMIARCKSCKAELVRHDYNASPFGTPGYEEDRYGLAADPVRQFITTVGSAEFAELRNTDEGRTCAACGHVNDPFPQREWGWARQVSQTRAVAASYHALKAADPANAAEAEVSA